MDRYCRYSPTAELTKGRQCSAENETGLRGYGRETSRRLTSRDERQARRDLDGLEGADPPEPEGLVPRHGNFGEAATRPLAHETEGVRGCQVCAFQHDLPRLQPLCGGWDGMQTHGVHGRPRPQG